MIETIQNSSLYSAVLVIGSLLAALAAGPRLINAVIDICHKWRAKAIADRIYRSSGVASFTADDISHARRNYVAPSCMQTDPSDEDDLRTVVALGPLFRTIENHFEAGGQNRHVILLADSGMGKTSFCINYFAREMRKGRTKRRPVVIIPLGRGSALDEIKSVENKRETICFLDAFDEDPDAAVNPDGRLTELMNAASDFRNIVVTCRSQFFSSESAIPHGSGIMYVAPRKAGQSREFPLHRLFLAPFSKKQIRIYLRKQFPPISLRNILMRRQAHALVTSISELSTRPMLLELLPDLVRERRSITELFGLYEFLVEKWLERESDWIPPNDLREISIELSVRCYLQQRSGQGDRIHAKELERLASDHHAPLESWKLKSRSLLNRDISGYYKFAHRSVMEYLFLLAAIRGDPRVYTVEWTDLMKDLFVSWGNADPRETHEQAMRVLNVDHSTTGLFPLASPIRQPQRRSLSDCKQALKNAGNSFRQLRRIPVAWRNKSLRVTRRQSTTDVTAYMVHDSTHGISWNFNDLSRLLNGELRALYRDTRHSSYQSDTSVSRQRRLPSIEEVLVLWESEPYLRSEHGIGSVFDPNEMYWLGDSGDNGPLCCSFGDPLDYAQFRLLCSKSNGNRHVHLYELQNRYGFAGREPYKAMSVYVTDTS